MTKRASERHALSIALSVILTGTLAAQGREVVWNLSIQVTERDKRDIIDLAARLGIRAPKRIVDNRSPCPLVSVSSQPVVEGNRVTTTVLGMRQRSGPDCDPVPPGRNIHRRGNWIARTSDAPDGVPAVSNPHRVIRWRLRDGDWYRDVELGPDASYEDAEAIVLAIRRGRLVDMRSADVIAKVRPSPSPLQPDHIFWVARLRDPSLERLSPEIYADMYVVMFAIHEDFTGRGGGGHLLHVKIRNGRVELHGWSTWMS